MAARASPACGSGEGGFSLLELAVAAGIAVGLMTLVLWAVHPANGLFNAQSETADLQQRLRVAAQTLYDEFQHAGGGTDAGDLAGALFYHFAPVLPYRQARFGDPAGVFRDDAISVIYASARRAVAKTATPLPAQSATVDLELGTPCPTGSPACGFSTGMNVIVVDGVGAYSRFTVLAVGAVSLDLRHDLVDSSRTFPPGSTVLGVEGYSYYVAPEPTTGVPQLVRTDGDGTRRVPVVDHVVSVGFGYFGDARPPSVLEPAGVQGYRTTYGPSPPPPDVLVGGYPAGENCVFIDDGGALPSPRLPTLAGAPNLVRMPPAHLTDGPWCPDAFSPARFDADLLRLRAVDVTIRVESALAALRGPAGTLFARGGHALGASVVPDIEARFRVALRNMSPEY